MDRETQDIYKKVISALSTIELVVPNKEHFSIVRKQMLDIANDILRVSTQNEKQ